MTNPAPPEILERLWQAAGLAGTPPADLAGEEPALPSSFRLGAAAQAVIAATTAAAAEIHRRRGGPAQRAQVAMRHAALDFAS